MRRVLQIAALLIVFVSLLAWAALGANRGWTRTSVAIKTIDEVTGIEGITYAKKFVPGVEILGGAFLGAGLLGGASFLIRSKSATKQTSK